MTTKEIKDILNSSNSIYEEFKEFISEGKYSKKEKSISGLNFKIIDYDGGSEGDGADINVVFSVNEKDLFSASGSHDSWNGNDWEYLMDFYRVVPKEKTIIVYESVKETE